MLRTLALIPALIVAQAASASFVLNEAQKAQIRNVVGDKLLDSESARWRWPRHLGGVGYCGWVNSKNRMGAYTGWHIYAVIAPRGKDGKLVVVLLGFASSDEAQARQVVETCDADGYDVSGPPPA